MKTIFKSLFAAVLFTGLGTSAFAQLGETETIDITARVLKQIVLDGTEVQFGAVVAGNVAVLDPIDPADNAFVSISAFAGRMTVDASGGEIIRVTYPAAVTLVHTNTTDQINYVPRISVIWGDVSLASVDRQSSVLLDDDDAFVATTAVTGAAGTGTGGLGYFSTQQTAGPGVDFTTFFIGGNLYEDASTVDPIPGGQETGTYSADMTFDITYFGI